MATHLVISGGGVNGIMTLGALQLLYEKELLKNIETFVGTSSGAIISFLLIIGYYPEDVYKILCSVNFEKLLKLKSSDIDAIYETIKCNLLEEYPAKVQFGIYSQDNLFIIIEKMMASKQISKNITFKELYDLKKKELVITGVCVNDVSVHYFSHKTHENMEILTALRISSCVPLLFKPVEYDGKLWIDGGCMDNYPVKYLKENTEYIGLYIDYEKEPLAKIENESQYISQLLKCIILNGQTLTLENEKNTIILKTNFGNAIITTEKKIELYNAGYSVSIEKFLKS